MAVAATTPFTIGAGPACADGACGTVSRSARGRDAVNAADGPPPVWPRVPLALHRGAVNWHG
jgi:hypothetical protein